MPPVVNGEYNDQGIDWSVYDVIIDGRIGVQNAEGIALGEDDILGWPTHIPLIPVAEALGATVEWDADSGEVTLEGLNGEISFTVGTDEFQTDGREVRLNQPSQVVDGNLYVPILFFRDVFGAASAMFAGGIIEINTEDAGDMF